MTNDVIIQIKQNEKEASKRIEKANADASEKIRRIKTDFEAVLNEEKEKCRLEFEKNCEEATEEAAMQYSEAENAAMAEAKEFAGQANAKLPDAVKFIVGGIIRQWR